ncbi:uncharacterized protein [Heterodontus francisci]|uniref:uncharacterized protein n=1 Tax=Heterodontus francisci TaxID=7792 RepID=UPI00355B6ACF
MFENKDYNWIMLLNGLKLLLPRYLLMESREELEKCGNESSPYLCTSILCDFACCYQFKIPWSVLFPNTGSITAQWRSGQTAAESKARALNTAELMWCWLWCLTDNSDHRMLRNPNSCISTLSSGLLLLVLAEHVSGQQSGVESSARTEVHSVPIVAALAMCLSALLFLLMLCVLFSPKARSQHCRCRRKAEDWTARGEDVSLPTYEEAVFGDQVKLCPISKISSLFPAGPHILQCGPQTVHCPTLSVTPFYGDSFGPSHQMDTVLNGTVLSNEAERKDLEEPPTYQDIYPTWRGRDFDKEEHWILPLTAAPLNCN